MGWYTVTQYLMIWSVLCKLQGFQRSGIETHQPMLAPQLNQCQRSKGWTVRFEHVRTYCIHICILLYCIFTQKLSWAQKIQPNVWDTAFNALHFNGGRHQISTGQNSMFHDTGGFHFFKCSLYLCMRAGERIFDAQERLLPEKTWTLNGFTVQVCSGMFQQ